MARGSDPKAGEPRGTQDGSSVGARVTGDGPVRDGARPVGHERVDQPAGQGLRHHRHRHPGRHHPLLPRHGDVHADRREDRRHHRAASCVRRRPRHLRVRICDDCVGADRRRPRARVVHSRRAGRRARASRDGRTDRRQLRGHRPQGGLCRDRRGRRRGDRGRADRRRLGHHRAVVARRVRRRGSARRLHSRDDALHRGRAAQRCQAAPRRRRDRALGERPRRRRARGAPVEHVGLGEAEGLARSSCSACRSRCS